MAALEFVKFLLFGKKSSNLVSVTAALELGNDNSQQPLHLPEEIIEQEILSRTSVKSLLKFRCVSKSWRCLIDSEQFIKAHLENSKENTSFLKHTVIFYDDGLQQYCNLQSLVNGASFHPVKDPPTPTSGHVSVVGGFNGVVCLLKRGRYFIMWNPSTRKSKILPEIDRRVTDRTKVVYHCGIGFESSGEYKIFAAIGERWFGDTTKDYIGSVYSSKTNSWNPVRREGSNMKFVETVGHFLNGKLHWKVCQAPFNLVVSFDLKSEVFALIELSERVPRGSWSLGVLGGKLCALFDYAFCRKEFFWRMYVDVWVMKEYGVKDSWQKFELPFPTSASFLDNKKGEVVVFVGHTFLVYNLKENVFEYMDGIPSRYGVLMCMESLVQL